MTPPKLPDPPVEIYRRICTYLPSQSALDLLLVNRFVYNACNDWTIWREVIRHNGDFVFEHRAGWMEDARSWKRYVTANSKLHTVDELNATDVAQWLPQLVAFNRKLHPADTHHARLTSWATLFMTDSIDLIIHSTKTANLASFCNSIWQTPLSITDEWRSSQPRHWHMQCQKPLYNYPRILSRKADALCLLV
jgi:hypothetical protein